LQRLSNVHLTAMLLFATTVALSFLGPLVNAQSTNDTALGIAAIEAHFTNAQIVPELLSTFDPSALMTVTFTGVGAISPGQNLSMTRESLPLAQQNVF
jgi:phosphatidylethanolamine-binding protein